MQTFENALLLERVQRIPQPLDTVFEFFSDAANLEALTPPFLRFQILSPLPIEMKSGARIEYSLSLFRIPFRWKTVISLWEDGVRFVDQQESGPYALWHHTHEFQEEAGVTVMKDIVRYRLPFGVIGRITHELMVKRILETIFDYRRDAVQSIFQPTA